MPRLEYRYKSVIIPIIKNKYVVVEDSKYNELTFVVGGCKKYETSLKCAIRELNEETRNVFGKYITEYDLKMHHQFESSQRSKQELAADKRQKIIVRMIYTVYIVDLNDVINNFNSIRNNYHRTRSINKETSDILLRTKEQLQTGNMWRFMKENVLNTLS